MLGVEQQYVCIASDTWLTDKWVEMDCEESQVHVPAMALCNQKKKKSLHLWKTTK